MKKILKCFIPCFIAATMCLGLVQASSFIKAEEETVEQVQEETTPTEPETATEQEPVEEDPVPEESTNEQPITEETETSDPVEEETESVPELEENQDETTGGVPLTLDAVTLDDSTPTFVPSHNKKIKYNGNDEYTLKLDVTGKYESETTRQPVDVLLIIDKSGSMNNADSSETIKTPIDYNTIVNMSNWEFYSKTIYVEIDGNEYEVSRGYNGNLYVWDNRYIELTSDDSFYTKSTQSYTKMDNLKKVVTGRYSTSSTDAGDGLADILFVNNKDKLDVRMAAVAYSGQIKTKKGGNSDTVAYDDAETVSGWTSSQSDFESAILGILANGGTNPQAGFYEATKTGGVAKSFRSNAQKYVIFLTDGFAGYYYDTNGYTKGSGNGNNDTAKSSAVNAAASITGLNGFYTIAFGSGADSSLTTEMIAAMKYLPDANKGSYSPANLTELTNVFNTIAAQITEIKMTNVTIQDTLSGYVDLIPDQKITVVDSNGNAVPDSSVSVNGKTITATFGTEANPLKENETYSIQFDVKVNQSAYDKYAEQNGYGNIVGDANTDLAGNTTSSGKPGFYSNDNANTFVSYTYKGETGKVAYQKPVVQVDETKIFRNLTISKDVTGLFGDKKRDFSFQVYLTKPGETKYSGTIEATKGDETQTLTFNEDGYVTVELSDDESITLKNIQYNSTYKVVEEMGNSEGYTTTVKVGDGNATSGKETTGSLVNDTSILFTNDKQAVPLTGINEDDHSSLGMIGIIVAELGAIYLVLRKKRQLKM